MCDFTHNAQAHCARPTAMHDSCHELGDNLSVTSARLQQTFADCDNLQPCRNACPGVDAIRVDYVMAMMRITFPVVPAKKDGLEMCATRKPVMDCIEKPMCEHYLSVQGISPETLNETAVE